MITEQLNQYTPPSLFQYQVAFDEDEVVMLCSKLPAGAYYIEKGLGQRTNDNPCWVHVSDEPLSGTSSYYKRIRVKSGHDFHLMHLFNPLIFSIYIYKGDPKTECVLSSLSECPGQNYQYFEVYRADKSGELEFKYAMDLLRNVCEETCSVLNRPPSTGPVHIDIPKIPVETKKGFWYGMQEGLALPSVWLIKALRWVFKRNQ